MDNPVVDLRSDTVTKPTVEMRRVMADADVGDDMLGEDPTVNRLEERLAELFGKESAVFACSGTQSNQMGVWAHCQRGDELIIEETGHLANYESGAPAVLSGVSVRRLRGDAGRLDVEHLDGQIRGKDQHFAPTRLLCLENSTNLGGGRTYPLDQLLRVHHWAIEQGLKVHLDGARLFNACAARGYLARDVGRLVDTVSICFSKGLGCPMGSALVGSAEEIARARRARKLFGGALRQAGIVAAACLYALDAHIDRLGRDHEHARMLAEALAEIPGISVVPDEVETNLVFFGLDPQRGPASRLAEALKLQGVLLYDVGPQALRACTHLDVGREAVLRAAGVIRSMLAGPPPAGPA